MKCFSKQIGIELVAKNPTSLKDFYAKVCEQMAVHASGMCSFFTRPIFDPLYGTSPSINKTAKIDGEDVLSQLLLVRDEVNFLLYLRTFFLNIYEFITTPIKVLLLLIQEFFFEPKLGLLKSEQRLINEARNKRGSGTKDRVLFFLETWIKKREKDFLFGKPEMLEMLISFLKFIKQNKTIVSTFSSRLTNLVQLVHHLKERKKKLMCSHDGHLSGLKYKQMLQVEERFYEERNMNEFFLKSSNQDIAITLFIIDALIFFRMNSYELNPKRINDESKKWSQAYSDYVYRLNTVTYLYVYMILSQQNGVSRLAMMKKLIGLARLMRTSSPTNLEGYQHIKLAFDQVSIRELDSFHLLLQQRSVSGNLSLDKDELEEYHLLMNGKKKEDIDDLMKTLKSVSGPCIPSTRPFVQFIVSSNDKWTLYKSDSFGRSHLNIEKLCKFSDIYNFLDKMHLSDATRNFLKGVEGYTKQPLYYFLEKGYQKYLSSTLHVKDLDKFELQDTLYRLSRKVQGRESI
jgi:hypothetical protein